QMDRLHLGRLGLPGRRARGDDSARRALRGLSRCARDPHREPRGRARDRAAVPRRAWHLRPDAEPPRLLTRTAATELPDPHPRGAPARRPADRHVGPRRRPDHGVDGSLAGACAAARIRGRKECRRTSPRGRVLRRRRDGQRVARRQGAPARNSRRSDSRTVSNDADGVSIRVPELIERKRDGGELAADEIAALMLGYSRDEIPDYQLAAWCMAVFFRGLSSAETYALTDALIRTGDTIDLAQAIGRKVVDKHSTGGVG